MKGVFFILKKRREDTLVETTFFLLSPSSEYLDNSRPTQKPPKIFKGHGVSTIGTKIRR